MSLLFGDSFGHYNGGNLTEKYDAVFDNNIAISSTIARTGGRCLQIVSGASGPIKLLGANFQQLIVQVAFSLDTPGASQQTTIFQARVNGVGYNIAIRVNGDSSFSIWRGNPGDGGSVELKRTDFRAAIWNCWNYVECSMVFSDTNGSVVLNVNGRQIANLTGIRTTATIGNQFADSVQLYGAPSNGAHSYLADFVVLDPSVAPNTAFLDGCKVYVTVPTADGNPVAWAPLAGANWQNVSTVPPNEATYNSSSTVGQIDQYSHPAIAPGGSTTAAIQHVMDLVVDSGARTVASDIAGTVGTGFALTTTNAFYCTPSDTAPAFPLAAGPKVTA